jgi:hypothetical protein
LPIWQTYGSKFENSVDFINVIHTPLSTVQNFDTQVVRTRLENRRGLTRTRRAEMERFLSGLSPVMSPILIF